MSTATDIDNLRLIAAGNALKAAIEYDLEERGLIVQTDQPYATLTLEGKSLIAGEPLVSLTMARDEANSIAGALDTLAAIDEGEYTDTDELIRLRDLILRTPGVH